MVFSNIVNAMKLVMYVSLTTNTLTLMNMTSLLSKKLEKTYNSKYPFHR